MKNDGEARGSRRAFNPASSEADSARALFLACPKGLSGWGGGLPMAVSGSMLGLSCLGLLTWGERECGL